MFRPDEMAMVLEQTKLYIDSRMDNIIVKFSDIYPTVNAQELILGTLQAGGQQHIRGGVPGFFATIKNLPRKTTIFLNLGIVGVDMNIPCTIVRTDNEPWQISASTTVAMESASNDVYNCTVMTIRIIISEFSLYCAVLQDFSTTT